MVDGHALRRAVVRRHAAAVLPQRPAARRPASTRRRARWDEWHAGDAPRSSGMAAPDRYAILLPLNEFEPLLALGAAAAGAAAARRRPLRQLPQRRLPARARRSTPDMFDNGWAPALTNTQISNVWDEFGRGQFAFYISGPWNIGEFKRRLPPEQQGDWMTAPLPGPDGPGASTAGGSSLVIFRVVAAQGCGMEADRVPVATRRAAALPRADRRPAAAPQRPGTTPALRRRRACARVPRPARARARRRPRCRSGSASPRRCSSSAERVVRGGEASTHAAAELDARVDAILEKRRWMLQRARRQRA